MKKCRHCAEEILEAAKVCKHCGREPTVSDARTGWKRDLVLALKIGLVLALLLAAVLWWFRGPAIEIPVTEGELPAEERPR